MTQVASRSRGLLSWPLAPEDTHDDDLVDAFLAELADHALERGQPAEDRAMAIATDIDEHGLRHARVISGADTVGA